MELPFPPSPMYKPKFPPTEEMCKTCPFKPDGTGYAVNHPDFPNIVTSVMVGRDFFCHQTVLFDKRTKLRFDNEIGDLVPEPEIQPHFRHCMGAMLLKQGKLDLPQPKKKKGRKRASRRIKKPS